MALAIFADWSTRKPIGLAWRSHFWFTTIVMAIGITADIVIYSILIPVLPFRLEQLGYNDVAVLVGYMLFAFSGGVVISTIPIAWFSERFNSRTGPLYLGMGLMILCQILLMFARKYWLMVLSRVLQGVASSVIWIVGLALVCDMTPERHIGRQLGIVMSGFSIGIVLGPAVGGGLYDRFGWRGPLIFAIIGLGLDLIGRILIIDRTSALKYGIDPKQPKGENPPPNERTPLDAENANDKRKDPAPKDPQTETVPIPFTSQQMDKTISVLRLSLLKVIGRMGKSPRALAPLLFSLIYGLMVSMQETTTPLHLKDVWDLSSTRVGLVFLAASLPPLVGAPILGWLTDRFGTEWTLTVTMLLAVPWWCIIIIQQTLALFIVAFTMQMSLTSSVTAPIMAELALAANQIEGVGYAHIYGAFNLLYGVGSCIGPIIGGEIYEHSPHGWLTVCLIGAGLMLLAGVLAFCLSGNVPLLVRLKQREITTRGKGHNE